MTKRSCLSVILAAGEGTRMKSALPKVLHQIAGLPMVAHVVKAAQAAGADGLALVIGHGAEEMRKAAQKFAPGAECYVQEKRLGTAHAVLAARDGIAKGYDDILVMFGDTPLIDPAALAVARGKLAEGAAVVVIGFRPPSPTGYGRLIEKNGRLVAIREEKDCSEDEKKIGFCNAGMMAVAERNRLIAHPADHSAISLGRITSDDRQDESGSRHEQHRSQPRIRRGGKNLRHAALPFAHAPAGCHGGRIRSESRRTAVQHGRAGICSLRLWKKHAAAGSPIRRLPSGSDRPVLGRPQRRHGWPCR